MTSPDPFDPRNDPDLTAAAVVDLTAERQRRTAQAAPVADPDTNDTPRRRQRRRGRGVLRRRATGRG